MIKGVGIDIISLKRIKQVIERQGQAFLDRVFTHDEQAYCELYPESELRYGGRFACKEAIGKAFGCGIGRVAGWHEFEILNDPSGRPYLNPGPKIKEAYGEFTMLLSISHCEEYATAVAIWTDHSGCV